MFVVTAGCRGNI